MAHGRKAGDTEPQAKFSRCQASGSDPAFRFNFCMGSGCIHVGILGWMEKIKP